MGSALFHSQLVLNLVFWNGSETNPAEIETERDEIRIQSWTENQMVYSRLLSPVDGAVVLYFNKGKWLHLTGAD